MARRGRVKPTRSLLWFQFAACVILLVVCAPTAIRVGGAGALLFVGILVALVCFAAYSLVAGRGSTGYEVELEDDETGGGPRRGDFDTKLRKLAKLHEDGLVTDEEFERKRAEIMAEKW